MFIINNNETGVSFSALFYTGVERESKACVCCMKTSANVNEVVGAEPVLWHAGVLESRRMKGDGNTCVGGLHQVFSSRSRILGLVDTWDLGSE